MAIVKPKKKKVSFIVPLVLFLFLFYYTLQVMSLIAANDGKAELDFFNMALENYFKFNIPLVFNAQTLGVSLFVGGLAAGAYILYVMDRKDTSLQDKAQGTSEWQEADILKDRREKNVEGNIILSATEEVSKNPKTSHLNRNITVVGRPGTGKTKFFLEPNILNATGGLVITDPKGEILRDTGNVLIQKGYDIKVFDLDEKRYSNHYNPFMYIRKKYTTISDGEIDDWYNGKSEIQEDDVMTLINVIMINTKSKLIDNTSGDPFWEKAETLFLQALFYYILEEYKDDPLHQNIPTIMKLLRQAKPDKKTGRSKLDELFDDFAKRYSEDNIAVKQWRHFKVTDASNKMMATIITSATTRLSVFNIKEIEELTSTDDMELDRIGMPTDKDKLAEINKNYPKKSKHGKVAWFVIVKPSDDTYNFIATIMYTQMFQIIDENQKKCGGKLITPLDFYLDEWAQMGEIPRFQEELAYFRSLNVGCNIFLQSLAQLKKYYENTWDAVLDDCDILILLGSNSKDTLEYFSVMLGSMTIYKASSGRTYGERGSSSRTYDTQGMKLAEIDQLRNLGFGKAVILISNFGAFYSELYDIKKHPWYSQMYDSWDEERSGKYRYEYKGNTFKNNEEKLNSLLSEMGFSNFKVLPQINMKSVSEEEIKALEDKIYTTEEVLESAKG